MDVSGISPAGVNPHAVRSVVAFATLSVITALAATLLTVLVSQGIPPSFPLSATNLLIAGLVPAVVFALTSVAVRVFGYTVEENKGKKGDSEQEKAEKKKQAELQEKEAEATRLKAKVDETKNAEDKKKAEAEATKAKKEAEQAKADLEKMKAKADKKKEKNQAEQDRLKAEAEKLQQEKKDAEEAKKKAEEAKKKAEEAQKKAEEDLKKTGGGGGKGTSHLNPHGTGNTGAAGKTSSEKTFKVESGTKKDPLKKQGS